MYIVYRYIRLTVRNVYLEIRLRAANIELGRDSSKFGWILNVDLSANIVISFLVLHIFQLSNETALL